MIVAFPGNCLLLFNNNVKRNSDLQNTWSSCVMHSVMHSVRPLLFNVFINDLFYFIKTGKLYNYADDTTVTYSHKSLSTTKSVLESESTKAIKWFGDNKMQANPDKFQAIIPGKSGHENCTSLTICGSEIKCEDSVKLLGVTIDFMLNFDTHVSDICRKAAKQINVLLRIGRHLTVETKILIYKSFIKSNFNYCPLVWHFCSKGSTAKMEKLQYRALRLVISPVHMRLSW